MRRSHDGETEQADRGTADRGVNHLCRPGSGCLLNSGIVDLTLAATLIEVLKDDTRRQRLIVVADIKMPLATATSLRGLLDKIILAAQPTLGGPN